MNCIRTTKTYKTAKNAEKHLVEVLSSTNKTLDDVRYLIAVSPDGRFAPVLVGDEYLVYVHCGVTVVA
jgi:hypothetical protein